MPNSSGSSARAFRPSIGASMPSRVSSTRFGPKCSVTSTRSTAAWSASSRNTRRSRRRSAASRAVWSTSGRGARCSSAIWRRSGRISPCSLRASRTSSSACGLRRSASSPTPRASERRLLQIAPEPLEDVPKALEPVARLARARHLVVLAREADEADRAAELLERDEELLALFDRAAQILLGVNDQQRRHDVLRVRERRALDVARHVLPRHGAAQLRHVEAMADVAGAEHRVLAVHRALRARRLEAPRVADDPAREKSAVAAAEHAETIRIEERIARERLVERRHDVGIVAAAP